MSRPSVVLATFMILFLSSLAFPAASGSSTPLRVDAGFSAAVASGGAATLEGVAMGGTPPYAFAWTLVGDGFRFSPQGASTSFDTAGLAGGTHVVTLSVTDAEGAIASDTVLVAVGASSVLLDRTFTFTAGVPEEVAAPSVDKQAAFFQVPEGLGSLEAMLDWDDASYDLDLVVSGPGADSGTAGATSARPERVTLPAPAKGTWRADVEPFLSGPTTAHLVVRGVGGGDLPVGRAQAFSAAGVLDEADLYASADGGVAPYSFLWDLDGDGWFETPGQRASASFPVGEHVVRVKVTDAQGFEVPASATLRVLDVDGVLRFRCGADADAHYWMMEFNSTKGSCWMHGGHHTYFVGDSLLSFRGLTGFAYSVEQQFAPPADPHLAALDPFASHLRVETSVDGITWREVGVGRYQFLPAPDFAGDLTRQYVLFDVPAPADPIAFRFLRVREPLSASQGLSGYLDHTHLDVAVDLLPPEAAPAAAPRSRQLSCERDILEDFFASHPCWFGGADRYDAPSFWHTYPLGGLATLDRVAGSFTLAPWRVDDWTQGQQAANATNVKALLLTSEDGVSWTLQAEIPATYGRAQSFDVPLAGVQARFVQLFPDYHARFDQTADFAPNHHPKGYFLDSAVTVEGDLPPVGSG